MENGNGIENNIGRDYKRINKESFVASSTVNERVLCRAMLSGKTDETIGYSIKEDGKAEIEEAFSDKQFEDLVKKFKKNPIETTKIAEENLFKIATDKNFPEDRRLDRVKRYTNAYLSLITKLDNKAFPADEKVRIGMPSYIPDGFSDMSLDPRVESETRFGEKIRVNKDEIYERFKDLFYEVFSLRLPKGTETDGMERYLVEKVNERVYNAINYDYKKVFVKKEIKDTVALHLNIDEGLGVCRHQALTTQVLLQAFNVDSKLMKANVQFSAGKEPKHHANNLVKIENRWHLLDVTNPDKDINGDSKIFLKKLPELNIDLKKKWLTGGYKWTLKDQRGKERVYQPLLPRAFSRIMDNKK